MVPAVTFYDVVLSVHVMAVVAAFGLWFAYPLLVPRGDAAAHRAHDLADGVRAATTRPWPVRFAASR
jgi:hypothetical protein